MEVDKIDLRLELGIDTMELSKTNHSMAPDLSVLDAASYVSIRNILLWKHFKVSKP